MSTVATDGACCLECGDWLAMDKNGGYCCPECMQPVCSTCYRQHLDKERLKYDGNVPAYLK